MGNSSDFLDSRLLYVFPLYNCHPMLYICHYTKPLKVSSSGATYMKYFLHVFILWCMCGHKCWTEPSLEVNLTLGFCSFLCMYAFLICFYVHICPLSTSSYVTGKNNFSYYQYAFYVAENELGSSGKARVLVIFYRDQ